MVKQVKHHSSPARPRRRTAKNCHEDTGNDRVTMWPCKPSAWGPNLNHHDLRLGPHHLRVSVLWLAQHMVTVVTRKHGLVFTDFDPFWRLVMTYQNQRVKSGMVYGIYGSGSTNLPRHQLFHQLSSISTTGWCVYLSWILSGSSSHVFVT